MIPTLLEGEQQFQVSLDDAPVGVCYTLPDGRFVRVNEAFCHLVGYTQEELREKTWHEITHPEDLAADQSLAGEILTGRIPNYTLEKRYLRKDGSAVWVNLFGKFVRDEAGEVRYGVGVVVDITERKRAEEILRREQELLQTIIDTIPVMITLYEPDTAVLRVNREFERVTGWTALDGAGMSLMELCYPDPAVRERAQEFMAACREGWMDSPLRTRDGRDIETSWANVRLSDGRQVGLGMDVSERKRAEEDRERFAFLVENSHDFVGICDMEGLPLYMNTAGMQMVGLDGMEEVLRTSVEEFFFPEDRAFVRDEFFPRVVRDGAGEVEIRFRHFKTGEPLWMTYGVVAIKDASGRATALATISRNIAERKQMEEALRKADRRKDEFLATLAHELRNPLAPIRNSLYILKMGGDDGTLREKVTEVMDRQVSHLVRLVDDLLEVSRISRGKIELRRELVDLARIVQNAVEISRPLIDAAGHRLTFDLPGESLTLEADPVRLAQVIANLLNNAAKYTEPGGKICLAAHRDGTEIVVSVRDSGVGIPAEMLPRVFEMFTQVPRSLDRAQGGLGIGLTLVQSLTRLHGGEVEARSGGPGQGSEFVVRLPAAPGDPA